MEGRADLIIFDDDGKIANVLGMGDYASGRIFYYRLCAPYFHTVIVRADLLTFHETTNGPFQRSDTMFAPWSPDESDLADCQAYLKGLVEDVEAFAAV